MSLDISENSNKLKTFVEDDQSSKDSSPRFKNPQNSGGLGVFKYPLILLALGLIFTALILENPKKTEKLNSVSGQGLLPNQPTQSDQAAMSDGEEARSWLAGWIKSTKGENLEEAFDKAEALTAEGKPSDAYLVYFYAARKGHGSAAMKLAEQSNPQTFSEQNSVTGVAEPYVAYKWYQRAAASGIPEASTRLLELQAWTQAEAKKGNLQAERLLLQWR